jgi:hypothetical protein
MKRRFALAATWALAACSELRPWGPSFGIVVDYNVMRGAATKEGVTALSDTGQRVFGKAVLPQQLGRERHGGGVDAYSFAEVPRSVRVTWCDGTKPMTWVHGVWQGTIVGDYRIEVASRIPRDVLEYASARRGRALRLIFRVLDDGVLLAWDVQEVNSFGDAWMFSHHGGDFVDPVISNGKFVEPGWYLAPDGRKVILGP